MFQFAFNMRVSWIFCRDFFVYQNDNSEYVMQTIIRRFKVKWWSKFHETNYCPKAINSWILELRNIDVPKISKNDQDKQADFLKEKLKLLAMFNQCKTTEELTII